MLQYSFGKFLENKGYEVRYDISDFSTYKLSSFKLKDIFNIDLQTVDKSDTIRIKDNSDFLLSRIRRKIFGRNRYHIMQKDFNLNSLDNSQDYYLDGYWHSLRYHKTIEDIIKSEFVVKKKSSKAEDILSQIKETHSVSVHFRRGDYVKDRKNTNRYYECNFNYYNPAAGFINEKIQNPTFFAFSDDIEWVKENFRGFNTVYVEGTEDYEDLSLMYNCKHNIIANSTFSWWGAYLNPNKSKIVIAPENWFKNINRNKNIEFIEDGWKTL
jgi:hypothetical protein